VIITLILIVSAVKYVLHTHIYVTALYFPVCCHGLDREYPKIYEINSVLLHICVIALVDEGTSRYCIRALGYFLLSYALKHIWGFPRVGFDSLDLNTILVVGVYLCLVLKIFHHVYIHCSCYLQYWWGGWSVPVWGSCSVCSGGCREWCYQWGEALWLTITVLISFISYFRKFCVF